MKTIYLNILLLVTFFISVPAQTPTVYISPDFTRPSVNISPTLFGIFYEDVNYSADGGLYAELIRNRSFEDNAASPVNWNLIQTKDALGNIALDDSDLLNTAQHYALKLSATQVPAGNTIGIANSGFWGINVVNGREYSVSFFAKCNDGFTGNIIVSLESTTGTRYAIDTLSSISKDWRKYSTKLIATGNNASGQFVIRTDSIGILWFDIVSVFPPTFNNRPNGLRPDLANMIRDIKPKFMRFPGGTFIEGDSMSHAYRWKQTIGSIETRPGHQNFWGYRTSDGIGMHELLQFCEDLGCEPLYVANAGMAFKESAPMDQLDPWIQDALDAIEYANGDTSATWGHQRMLNGHPQPFNMKYIEIGNENWGNPYSAHYILFYNAIKAKYPYMNIICNTDDYKNIPIQIYDYHVYSTPSYFIKKENLYDNFNRSAYKIYVGEYAVIGECGTGNLKAAVAEAAFMTGLERNSDVVIMGSYAPLLANVNGKQWNPDAIYFNSSSCYGTPSYYIQKLFSNNIGNTYIPMKDSLNGEQFNPVTGKIGLGSNNAQVLFDSIEVKNGNTSFFFDNCDSTNSLWKVNSGSWNFSGGNYNQTSSSYNSMSLSYNVTDTIYTYTLKAMKTGGNGGFSIIIGWKDDSNFIRWNIGGWNNNLTTIERYENGLQSFFLSSPDSVAYNVWYYIKIECTKTSVTCYLNNQLIFSITPVKKLFYSLTLDTVSDTYFLKVVNPYETGLTAQISLQLSDSLNYFYGTETYLTSRAGNDENSFTNTLVGPFKLTITKLKPVLSHFFEAYSATIFKLTPVYLTTNQNIIDNKKPNKNSILIFPNPARNNQVSFNLDYTYGKPTECSLISITGKILYIAKPIEKPDRSFLFNFKPVPNGVYIIKVSNNQKEINKLIHIQNN